MTNMKKTTVVALATIGLTTGLFAYGMNGNCGGNGMGNGHGKHMKGHGGMHRGNGGMLSYVKQLDLTTEQKVKLMDLRESQKEKRMGMRKNHKDLKMSMKADMSKFMTAEKFDKAAFIAQRDKKIEEMQKQREATRSARLENRANMMEKVFNILTPQQREKLIQLSKKS
ncbi:Periplasmic protein related to spheroblast formation [hydrothermal vent metagenome]|uniref:Periplasmic protein related to spheroblast formation n=1 Tax=hydrothermal vent metagenome TaxID=652676 RepID=A0A1W1EG56_9ZZZZ